MRRVIPTPWEVTQEDIDALRSRPEDGWAYAPGNVSWHGWLPARKLRQAGSQAGLTPVPTALVRNLKDTIADVASLHRKMLHDTVARIEDLPEPPANTTHLGARAALREAPAVLGRIEREIQHLTAWLQGPGVRPALKAPIPQLLAYLEHLRMEWEHTAVRLGWAQATQEGNRVLQNAWLGGREE